MVGDGWERWFPGDRSILRRRDVDELHGLRHVHWDRRGAATTRCPRRLRPPPPAASAVEPRRSTGGGPARRCVSGTAPSRRPGCTEGQTYGVEGRRCIKPTSGDGAKYVRGKKHGQGAAVGRQHATPDADEQLRLRGPSTRHQGEWEITDDIGPRDSSRPRHLHLRGREIYHQERVAICSSERAAAVGQKAARAAFRMRARAKHGQGTFTFATAPSTSASSDKCGQLY